MQRKEKVLKGERNICHRQVWKLEQVFWEIKKIKQGKTKQLLCIKCIEKWVKVVTYASGLEDKIIENV